MLRWRPRVRVRKTVVTGLAGGPPGFCAGGYSLPSNATGPADAHALLCWCRSLTRPAAAQAVAAVSGCSTVPGLVEVLAQPWSGRDEVRRRGERAAVSASSSAGTGLSVPRRARRRVSYIYPRAAMGEGIKYWVARHPSTRLAGRTAANDWRGRLGQTQDRALWS